VDPTQDAQRQKSPAPVDPTQDAQKPQPPAPVDPAQDAQRQKSPATVDPAQDAARSPAQETKGRLRIHGLVECRLEEMHQELRLRLEDYQSQ